MEKLTGEMLKEVWELMIKYAPEEELLKLIVDEFDITTMIQEYADLAEIISGYDEDEILDLIDNATIYDHLDRKVNIKETLEARRYDI